MGFFKQDISKLSDEDLMELLIRKNSHKALNELHHRYANKLLGYFIKMFKGDTAKAQDFLQDIFIKILEKRASFDTQRKFYTWVFTIASNMCKTEFRKPYFQELSDEHDIIKDTELLDNHYDKSVFKNDLKEKINGLEYHHKSVFILRYNERFTLKEIAEIQDISLGTVKSRLYYATKKIASELKMYNPKYEQDYFKIR